MRKALFNELEVVMRTCPSFHHFSYLTNIFMKLFESAIDLSSTYRFCLSESESLSSRILISILSNLSPFVDILFVYSQVI